MSAILYITEEEAIKLLHQPPKSPATETSRSVTTPQCTYSGYRAIYVKHNYDLFVKLMNDWKECGEFSPKRYRISIMEYYSAYTGTYAELIATCPAFYERYRGRKV